MIVFFLIISILNQNAFVAAIRDDNDPKNSILLVNTTSIDGFTFGLKNVECDKCPFITITSVNYNQSVIIIIDTGYPSYYFSIKTIDNNTKYCLNYEKAKTTFGESGRYLLEIRNSTDSSTNYECSFIVLEEPTNKYTPIIAAFLIYLGVAVLYLAGTYVYKNVFSGCNDKSDDNEPIINTNSESTINYTPPVAKKSSQRLDSVDTFRGLCLCIMIFVNYGAGEYRFLDHASWNGLHLADLVFPCFIYIMGVSMTLSFYAITSKARSFENGANLNVKNLIYKIIKRSILLYFFGLITSNDADTSLSTLRIFGVLQRFAISYFVCAILEIVHLRSRNYVYDVQESFEQVSWRSNFKEIFFYPIQWIVMFIFVLVWLLLTFLLPVPGCPTGYLGPGGLHDNASYYNCTGGAAAYIDRIILGKAHVYQYPTCRDIYHSIIPHDPEGILGCLTTCVLTYLGVTAGHIIIHYKKPTQRVIRLVAYGLFYGSIAMTLCKASKNDGWIPINKNLWSLSFILALSSIAFLVISILYLIIDVWKFYSGAPFIFPGKNSICIYICHIVFGNFFPVRFVTPITHAARLAMDLYSVTLWVIVAAILYYKKIFINL